MKSILSGSTPWNTLCHVCTESVCSRRVALTAMCVACALSGGPLFGKPRIAARQAPLSMRFPRQEHQSGLPFPPSGDLSDPRVKPTSPRSPAWAGSLPAEPPGKAPHGDSHV